MFSSACLFWGYWYDPETKGKWFIQGRPEEKIKHPQYLKEASQFNVLIFVPLFGIIIPILLQISSILKRFLSRKSGDFNSTTLAWVTDETQAYTYLEFKELLHMNKFIYNS